MRAFKRTLSGTRAAGAPAGIRVKCAGFCALLAPELQLVPRGHGCQLEQRTPAARVPIAELAVPLVESDLEQAFLHPVVEPRAPEDELAQPVDEGFVADERHAQARLPGRVARP